MRDQGEIWHGRVVGKQRGMPGYFVVNFGGEGDSGFFFYSKEELTAANGAHDDRFPPLGECRPHAGGSAVPIPDHNGHMPEMAPAPAKEPPARASPAKEKAPKKKTKVASPW